MYTYLWIHIHTYILILPLISLFHWVHSPLFSLTNLFMHLNSAYYKTWRSKDVGYLLYVPLGSLSTVFTLFAALETWPVYPQALCSLEFWQEMLGQENDIGCVFSLALCLRDCLRLDISFTFPLKAGFSSYHFFFFFLNSAVTSLALSEIWIITASTVSSTRGPCHLLWFPYFLLTSL